MPMIQQQLPTKAYYLDRLGNMSTSSSVSSTSSSSSISPVGVVGGGGAPANGRKQFLPLKPKQQVGYVQHLEHKSKDQLLSSSSSSSLNGAAAAPVTMLALKKKEKGEKNVVTQLAYRKPSSIISSGGSTSSSISTSSCSGGVPLMPQMDLNMMMLMNHQMQMHMNGGRRPGSPSSSGYETDSLLDQENCDVFSSLLNSTFGYQPSSQHANGMMHHHHDMLHSHPIWSPQPSTSSGVSSSSNGLLMSSGGASSFFHENEKNNNKFLIQ